MTTFKKILLSFMALAAVSLIFVGASYLASGRKLDAESKAAAEAVFTQLAAKWRYEDVVRLSDEKLLRSAPKSHFTKLLDGFRKNLGPLAAIQSCEGGSKVVLHLKDFSRSASAEYHIKAGFAKGPGEAFLRLGKVGEEWRLLMLNVQSPLLIK